MQTANDQWNCSRMDLETAQKKQRRPILSLVSFSSTPVPSEEPLKLSSLPPTSLDGEAPRPAWRCPSRLVQTFLLQPKFCRWLAKEEVRCLAKIKFDGEHEKASGEVSGGSERDLAGFSGHLQGLQRRLAQRSWCWQLCGTLSCRDGQVPIEIEIVQNRNDLTILTRARWFSIF